MICKISPLLLVLVYTYRVRSDCGNIANEDKIDCVQHESWTPASCVAKGCCYQAVAGFPACFYPYGNKHEARCQMSTGERRDCGNADTTEIQCINKGCCWQMSPGAPYCYVAKEGVPTDAPTSPPTEPTAEPTTPTPETQPTDSSPTEGPTDAPTGGPTGDCGVSASFRKECGDSSTDEQECKSKGCCWQFNPGSPTCYKKGGPTDAPTQPTDSTPTEKPTEGPTDGPTEVPTDAPTGGPTGDCGIAAGSRKECGDASTDEQECKGKGCCWEFNPGSPTCYKKGR